MISSSLLFLLTLQAAPKTTMVGTVEVHAALSNDMFPVSWRGGDIKARATEISPGEAARSLRIVKIALAKYPADLLKMNLKKIYLTRQMYFYDLPYGAQLLWTQSISATKAWKRDTPTVTWKDRSTTSSPAFCYEITSAIGAIAIGSPQILLDLNTWAPERMPFGKGRPRCTAIPSCLGRVS